MFNVLRTLVTNISAPIRPPTRFTSFADLAGAFVNFLIGISFAISIVCISYSMVMYILSKGMPENTKKAWLAFLWGVIAAMVTMGAISIRYIVISRLIGVSTPGIGNGLPDF